ncbi:uncharacterized protein [Miscanthus floridulus]|uniref:uncharacterized protein n=1 Tax=Miscanthus floridulus TaxID=154761 RepID=UPI00345859D0
MGPHPGTIAHRAHALPTSTMPRSTPVLVRLGADSMAATPSVSLSTGSMKTVVASLGSSSSPSTSPVAFFLAHSSSSSTRALLDSVSTTCIAAYWSRTTDDAGPRGGQGPPPPPPPPRLPRSRTVRGGGATVSPVRPSSHYQRWNSLGVLTEFGECWSWQAWAGVALSRSCGVVMMATHHDALWAKLHELELELAAYKLLRAARGDGDDAGFAFADEAETPGGDSTCRGRQYDAYMRRRDARRVAASAEQQQQPTNNKAQQARGVHAAGAGRTTPMSPRSALRCAARDTQEAGATPRVVITPAKRMPAMSSIPSTPRKEVTGAALPRSTTVRGGGGATGSPVRLSSHHQRRNSLGVLAEFGECATLRLFLKRGTGTGGAATPARLRATRVHDLPTLDVAITPRPLPQQQQEEEELGHTHAHTQAPRHIRSVSELPFETTALASPQARARKRWGSPKRPTAMFSDSHRDLSKGLKKLLSFMRKGGRSGGDGVGRALVTRRGGGRKGVGWESDSILVVINKN